MGNSGSKQRTGSIGTNDATPGVVHLFFYSMLSMSMPFTVAGREEVVVGRFSISFVSTISSP